MTIAIAADVEKFLGRTFNEDETTAADAQIALYQDELEGWLGRKLESTVHTDTLDLPFEAEYVPVKSLPVTAIASMTVNGTAVDSQFYGPNPNGVELFVSNLLSLVSVSGSADIAQTHAHVVVTYTGGIISDTTKKAKSIIVRRTGRYMNQRRDDTIGVSLVQSEGYKVEQHGDEFTEAELKSVSRLKRRVAI